MAACEARYPIKPAILGTPTSELASKRLCVAPHNLSPQAGAKRTGNKKENKNKKEQGEKATLLTLQPVPICPHYGNWLDIEWKWCVSSVLWSSCSSNSLGLASGWLVGFWISPSPLLLLSLLSDYVSLCLFHPLSLFFLSSPFSLLVRSSHCQVRSGQYTAMLLSNKAASPRCVFYEILLLHVQSFYNLCLQKKALAQPWQPIARYASRHSGGSPRAID